MKPRIPLLKLIVYGLPIVVCAAGVWTLAQDYYGYGGAYVDDRASTPAESYARGMSDVVRAQGAYNLATSAAAINAQEAVRRDIDNREKATSAYFDMRKTNRAARAQESGRRPTMEDAVRYAQMGKPKRLSPGEFDYVSGRISWPKLLQMQPFTDKCKELDELFTKRATYGGISFEEQMKIRNTTNAMMADLKGQIRDLPPSVYVAAKSFLQSLAYEGQLAAG